MTDSSNADEIQRQMAALRVNLHHDVTEIVENAKTLTDWHYYLRKYPWLCAGGAALLGYFLVPSKLKMMAPDVNTLIDLAKKHKLYVSPQVDKAKQGGLIGSLVGLAASAAMKGAVNYFSQQVAQRYTPPAEAQAAPTTANVAPGYDPRMDDPPVDPSTDYPRRPR